MPEYKVRKYAGTWKVYRRVVFLIGDLTFWIPVARACSSHAAAMAAVDADLARRVRRRDDDGLVRGESLE